MVAKAASNMQGTAVATRMVMTHRAAQIATQLIRMLVVITVPLVVGCANNRRPAQPEPMAEWMSPHVPWLGAQRRPVALVRFQDPNEARYHMRMHFGDLRMVEQLLVTGRLAEGLSVAYLLTRQTVDSGLARWAAQSSRVNAAALELTSAQDVDEALRRLARVAVECAGCHVAADSAPTFAPPPTPPPDRSTRAARMARHAWAAERLWEAIVGDDDARWRRGLAVLADAPLPSALLSDASHSAETLQVYARDQLDMRGATSIEGRARAYGEMLILCARCHATRDH